MKLTDAERAKAKQRALAAQAARWKREQTTLDWPGIIARFKQTLNELYDGAEWEGT